VKTNKAFIKLNGEIGSKEIPSIEYIDNDYLKELDTRKKAVLTMFENTTPENDSSTDSEIKRHQKPGQISKP